MEKCLLQFPRMQIVLSNKRSKTKRCHNDTKHEDKSSKFSNLRSTFSLDKTADPQNNFYFLKHTKAEKQSRNILAKHFNDVILF